MDDLERYLDEPIETAPGEFKIARACTRGELEAALARTLEGAIKKEIERERLHPVATSTRPSKA